MSKGELKQNILSSKYKLPVAAFAKRTSPAIEDILDLLREIVNLSAEPNKKM